jgi:hypothetical protein
MYTIKHNIPTTETGFPSQLQQGLNKNDAYHSFMNCVKVAKEDYIFPIKLFFRDDNVKPMRGQCQVEIDGFYYWIELFITPS